LGDCCHLPFTDNTFDYCMCVSVIHHLSTEERRSLCFREMVRVLKPGGHGLLNVWSQEFQEKRSFVSGDRFS
jgi:ubiquinone/menaquinone biosynthesis C-methylase UbiE